MDHKFYVVSLSAVNWNNSIEKNVCVLLSIEDARRSATALTELISKLLASAVDPAESSWLKKWINGYRQTASYFLISIDLLSEDFEFCPEVPINSIEINNLGTAIPHLPLEYDIIINQAPYQAVGGYNPGIVYPNTVTLYDNTMTTVTSTCTSNSVTLPTSTTVVGIGLHPVYNQELPYPKTKP
jgi:hypothetical protein